MVGATTTLLGNLMHGDFTGTWFALVQIVGAVIWAAGFRHWFGRTHGRFLLLNLLVAVACSAVALPIVYFIYSGAASFAGGDAVFAALQGLGQGFGASLISMNLLTSIADKLLSGYLALLLLVLLARAGFEQDATLQQRLTLLFPRTRR